MDTKTIYIVRHGETEQNRLGIVQGRGIDSSLNETGRIQSDLLYNHYKSIPFCRIYCSSQRRSFETIRHFALQTNTLIKDQRLDEICWGEHEGKGGEPELMKKYERIITSWSSGNYHDKPEGGESAQELYDRVKSFLSDLEQETFNTALICTHGRTLRAMVCLLQGKALRHMDDVRHYNTGLYQALYENSNWKILKENDCVHLQQNPVY